MSVAPVAPNARNVAAAKPYRGGGIYRAPIGTAVPTDASTALPADYRPLGYVSEDGVQPTRDTSIEKVKAWGGDIVAALLNDESRSFEFTLIEVFREDVQKFVHRDENVTTTAATASAGTQTAVLDRGGKPDECVLVFDMMHGRKRRRLVVPYADPSLTGELPYVDGGLSGYTFTVEAIKDSTGVRVYEYLENDDATG